MVININQLKEKYRNYTDILGKISRDEKNGNLIRLKNGLYETSKETDGLYLSSFIYSPSYLSFEYALYYYDLIPERVYRYTNATFNKRKTKEYKNYFGIYSYRDVPKGAFGVGVDSLMIDNYNVLIANKEKAICDTLYTKRKVNSINELKELMFEDLRIDETDFMNLDFGRLIEYSKLYHSKNLDFISKLCRRYL